MVAEAVERKGDMGIGHAGIGSHTGVPALDLADRLATQDAGQSLVQSMYNMAVSFARESGARNPAIEVRDNMAVWQDAPFGGPVVLYGINDSNITPYF